MPPRHRRPFSFPVTPDRRRSSSLACASVSSTRALHRDHLLHLHREEKDLQGEEKDLQGKRKRKRREANSFRSLRCVSVQEASSVTTSCLITIRGSRSKHKDKRKRRRSTDTIYCTHEKIDAQHHCSRPW
ncbi:unnamed protein product [Urochloa humidicola]